MMKRDKKNEKMKKKNEKTQGNLQFSIFWNMCAPLEAKMMKHNKK
jgi:hypothetical protein